MRTDQHLSAARPCGRWSRWSSAPGRYPRRAVLGLVGAALLVTACADPQEPVDESALREVQEERDDLRAELDAAEEDLRDAQRERDRLQEQLEQLEERDPEDTGEDVAPDEPARQRTPEGLIDQPRASIDPDGLPEGFEPGTTPWESYEFAEPVEAAFERPGELALEIAEAVGGANLGGPDGAWETTVRVLMDEDDPDLAYAAVLRWGFLDDAVAGEDVRVTLTRDDEGWRAGGAERRLHCIRGVTDDGLCA